MATKRELRTEPGSTWNKAGEDEVLFILRATDRTAPEAVLAWVRGAAAAGAPLPKVRAALDDFMALLKWQREHPGDVKTPD
jgi:hypothetical protein